MSLLNRIEELEKELLELKEQVKEEQEFPQGGDTYYYIGAHGGIDQFQWDKVDFDFEVQEIGNIYQTKEQAEFAVEKLKVETEMRKFSRPFKEDEYNYFILINSSHNNIVIDSDDYYQTQGTIYFESMEIANEAIDAIGADRIKKYLLGVEEQ